jgi:dimethylargininase
LHDVDEEESYAANCIWVIDTVIVAKGYPGTQKKIRNFGYKTLELDMSEFRKLDGGLSCLSLRF